MSKHGIKVIDVKGQVSDDTVKVKVSKHAIKVIDVKGQVSDKVSQMSSE